MGIPYFLQNLIPKREKRTEARPLLAVLAELTWVQWAQFFSGWVEQTFVDWIFGSSWMLD